MPDSNHDLVVERTPEDEQLQQLALAHLEAVAGGSLVVPPHHHDPFAQRDHFEKTKGPHLGYPGKKVSS